PEDALVREDDALVVSLAVDALDLDAVWTRGELRRVPGHGLRDLELTARVGVRDLDEVGALAVAVDRDLELHRGAGLRLSGLAAGRDDPGRRGGSVGVDLL